MFNDYSHRVGSVHKCKEGYTLTIIKYEGHRNITVQFNTKDKSIKSGLYYGNILRGTVKNNYFPKYCNIGFLGEGKYTVKHKSYKTWSNMIRRVYCLDNKNLSYKNVIVSEKWHNFQNFAEWFDNNYIVDFELDKDILSNNNRLYSPETCCFIPKTLNSILKRSKKSNRNLSEGVTKKGDKFQVRLVTNGKRISLGTFNTENEASFIYKKEKIKYIKTLADRYKNVINYNVYLKLLNYDKIL